MALRGLREKILYVHNPLPVVSDQELLKRADLEFIEASPRPDKFSWLWKFDAGLNHEVVRCNPGDFVALREKEAAGMLAEFAEQGAVALEDPEDPDELLKAKIKGLTAAQKFWIERGTRRAMHYRKVHGIGLEELKELKPEHWAWYQNQAAAEVVAEEITRLKAGGEVETQRARRKAAKTKKA
jgi:hypothetical protein